MKLVMHAFLSKQGKGYALERKVGKGLLFLLERKVGNRCHVFSRLCEDYTELGNCMRGIYFA